MTMTEAQFEDLYLDSYRDVHRFIFRFCHNQDVAEELTQDAFVKAFRARNTYRAEAPGRVWMFRIARNTGLDWLKSAQSRQANLPSLEDAIENGVEPGTESDTDGCGASPSIEQEAQTQQASACVQALILEMPENLRTPLILHDMEGFSNREIAGILGVSVAAAKMRLHRGRLQTREMMSNNCELFQDERDVLSCLPTTPDCELPSPEEFLTTADLGTESMAATL